MNAVRKEPEDVERTQDNLNEIKVMKALFGGRSVDGVLVTTRKDDPRIPRAP